MSRASAVEADGPVSDSPRAARPGLGLLSKADALDIAEALALLAFDPALRFGAAGGGGGARGGARGGGGLGMMVPQITNPERVTEPSVLQETVLPAVSITLLGPERPWYLVLPMVM